MLQIFSQRLLMLAGLTFGLLALDYLISEVLFEGSGMIEWRRAATTAFSLRSRETVEAQTRFEAASKQSNDPPLSRVNTLGSGEDSIKLKELM
ncbi:hypothetical protein Tco_0806120 [Tanacetum coccineum]